MAKRPPSSCTIGRSSGGMTGIASRIIHSGRLVLRRNADTTFRRFRARAWRWPLLVWIVSRRDSASASRSIFSSSSLIAAAPMPPLKNSPKPWGDPKRSFISRKSCSSTSIWRGLRSLKVSQARVRRSIASSV